MNDLEIFGGENCFYHSFPFSKEEREERNLIQLSECFYLTETGAKSEKNNNNNRNLQFVEAFTCELCIFSNNYFKWVKI